LVKKTVTAQVRTNFSGYIAAI